MANPDSVATYYLDSFGSGRIAVQQAVNLNNTANASITLPFLVGGLTKAAQALGSGSVIVRRITVNNPYGNVSNVALTITTSNDGNVSNAVVASSTLSNLTGPGTYQDLTIASPYNSSSSITGFTTQALYVNISVASGNVANTATISVYGDVVTF